MSRDKKIDYLEFNVSSIQKTKDFYGKAFGWTFTDYGSDYCEFTDGRMKGGFNATLPPNPGGPLVVLYGDDLEALLKAVKRAGGKTTKPVFDFPGGQRFEFTDPDGYELAVWCET